MTLQMSTDLGAEFASSEGWVRFGFCHDRTANHLRHLIWLLTVQRVGHIARGVSDRSRLLS
jgi:hypothetical protein